MPSGVEHPQVIDLVTHDPSTDEYALIMVEQRPWNSCPEQPRQLVEKICNYLRFVTSGQFFDLYPQASGRPLRFQLDCFSPPAGQITAVIEETSDKLTGHGVRFIVNILPSEEPDELSERDE